MTDPVGATAPVPYLPPTATTSIDRPDQLGKDAFLKLLVAQLKYQDPSNPASSTEFMSQTAQFSQVEKLDQILNQNATMLAAQQSLSAGAMVGMNVSYLDDNGETQSGTVTSVRFDPTESTYMVDGNPVPMGRVTEVRLPTGQTAGQTSPAHASV